MLLEFPEFVISYVIPSAFQNPMFVFVHDQYNLKIKFIKYIIVGIIRSGSIKDQIQ